MKVLVTGHLGYIGTLLVPMLLEEGYEVVGLDSDLYRRCTFLGEIAEVENIQKDVRDVELADLSGFDAVLHLAGLSNDPLGDLAPDITYDINHRGTVRLAELAKQAGVERFVFSSSCSNYGAAGDEFLDEGAQFNPVTPYGRSKVLSERDLSKLADGRFTPVYLRNATAYGVSPRHRFDLVLNNLVAWAFTTGKVYLKSDGSAWRPLVHIEDISRAFLAVLAAPREAVHDRAFNVGRTDQNLRIRELAEVIVGVVPDSHLEFAEGASADKRCYRVNCDLLPGTLPGFEARWDIRRAAEEALGAYREFGLELEEFEGPRFQRIGHIKKLLADGVLGPDLRHTASTATRKTP